MSKTIDACGRSCPEPVLLTKKALDANSLPLTVLVDNSAAAENVTRFAEHAGCKVSRKETDNTYTLSITK